MSVNDTSLSFTHSCPLVLWYPLSGGSESLRFFSDVKRKVDNAHTAQVSLSPGPKKPSRLILKNVESSVLLLRCRLMLQQRKVDLGVGLAKPLRQGPLKHRVDPPFRVQIHTLLARWYETHPLACLAV